MTFESKKLERAWETCYAETMALYATLRGSSQHKIRRAEIKQDGEVPPEPIDFICDVEIKGKRAFAKDPWDMAQWMYIVSDPLMYESFPTNLKRRLGCAFMEYNLGIGGHYKKLYFKIKNHQEKPNGRDEGNSTRGGEDPASGAFTAEDSTSTEPQRYWEDSASVFDEDSSDSSEV